MRVTGHRVDARAVGSAFHVLLCFDAGRLGQVDCRGEKVVTEFDLLLQVLARLLAVAA